MINSTSTVAGSQPSANGAGLSGLARIRRAVLDTGPLTTDILGAHRRGTPSPLVLTMLAGKLRTYAAHHVWAEVPRVLQKRAWQTQLPAPTLEKLWWDTYVPLIRFVDCDGLPTTEQSRALAKRDPSDTATLLLAGLLAPTVIIAEDSDILASGLAYEQWTDFYDVMRTLIGDDQHLQVAAILASLGVKGVSRAAAAAIRLASSPAGAALATGATVALAAASYHWRAEIFAAWARSSTPRRAILLGLHTSITAFAERVNAAERFWQAAQRGQSPATQLHRIASILSIAESPRTRTQLISALDLPHTQLHMNEIAGVLDQYPAFVEPTQNRWQLGRDSMNFGAGGRSANQYPQREHGVG